MVFEKDVRVVDDVNRLSIAVYLYLILYKKKSFHLSERELEVFCQLLVMAANGDLKKGIISKSIYKSNKSVYTYIERIKGVGLLKKAGDNFIFPPDILKIAESVVKKEEVCFYTKVYGN